MLVLKNPCTKVHGYNQVPLRGKGMVANYCTVKENMSQFFSRAITTRLAFVLFIFFLALIAVVILARLFCITISQIT